MRRSDREVTQWESIEQIIKQCQVCRLGLNDNGQVYIVPLNFGYCYEEGRLVLYFHSSKEGRKQGILKANADVGFEMDCGHKLMEGKLACQYSYYYASVIGTGKAEVVTDKAEKRNALGHIMKQMTGKTFDEFETNPKLEEMVSIIKVTVDTFSCKAHG